MMFFGFFALLGQTRHHATEPIDARAPKNVARSLR
jgi:hypothetical protein